MNKLYLLPVLITLFAGDPVRESVAPEKKKSVESGTYTAYHENGNKKFFLVQKKKQTNR